MKHLIQGRSDGVNFLPDARYRWQAAMKHFTGRNLTVTVERRTRRRSNQQNSYYWPVLVGGITEQLRSDGWDVTMTEVHELLKSKFAKRLVLNDKTGQLVTVRRSTTDLTTFEFSEYCEQIKQWAAETLELVLPDPNEYEIEI